MGNVNFGPLEIGIIVLIVLLLFGAKKLPELGASLGSGIREFGQGVTGKGGKEIEPEDPSREEAGSGKGPGVAG